MNKFLLSTGLVFLSLLSSAQEKEKLLKGMYFQWGYNTEWYTKSDIHFKSVVNGVMHDYTIYNAVAHDRNDLSAVTKEPLQVSVPQYNYRIGFYLNKKHSTAIELNFDHTKYIVYDNQQLHAKGRIGTDHFDTDTAFTADQMHFEHTNGANFYHINYVQQYELKAKNHRPLFSIVWKGGAGVLIPKTDITLSGKRVDNRFHVAGYCFGAEGGGRWFITKSIFLEGTAKTGYANYINALAAGNGKVNHSFGYFELIGSIGYELNF